jgi:uncharacterized membrane protein HdeD (DUF308 family)/alpha-beta hydrolase superfamily lysophospholipase
VGLHNVSGMAAQGATGTAPTATDGGGAGRWRWLRWTVAVVSIVVGLVLVLSPFASLGVLVLLVVVGLTLAGVEELLAARTSSTRALTLATGVVLLLAALLVALWPGATLRLVAVAVGVALLVSGAGRIARGVRGDTDIRTASVVEGVSVVILGLLALAWPDLTLFVVGVVLGVRLVLAGISAVVGLLRGRPRQERAGGGRRSWPRRWLRTSAAIVGLVLTLGLVGVAALLRSGAPSPDAFYEPPEQVPAQAGVLLRSEPFDRAIPDGAQAWRILYTTTRDDGVPAVASGLVVVPVGAGDGPLPVVTWAHGTTGATPQCAPSLLEDPFEAGAMFVLDEVIANGWAFVATDYVGLGTEGPHPYLVGQPEGRSVLDSVRAARQMEELGLSEQTVVWGHSQGGHAALWSGVLATDYAPDAGVVAVAALSPASNLPGLVANLDVVPGGDIFTSYVIEGYTETFDDVDQGDYVRPGASVLVDELASRCLSERSVAVSLVESLAVDDPLLSQDLTEGALGERLEQNVPTGPIDVPLLIGQGAADQLVLPEAQQAYVDQRCADGGQVDYRTYADRDHVPVVEPDSPLIPELLAWTQDRFDGAPADSTC